MTYFQKAAMRDILIVLGIALLIGLIVYAFVRHELHRLKEGTIIATLIEPEHDYLYMMPIPHTISTGKTSITTFTYIPIMMHDDEDYKVRIHGVNKFGEEKDEVYYVSAHRFLSLELGQNFCADETCSEVPKH